MKIMRPRSLAVPVTNRFDIVQIPLFLIAITKP